MKRIPAGMIRSAPDPVATEPLQIEAEARRLCDAGDHAAAATVAIEGYGPELLGFLIVLAGDPADAGEVFADLCVRIWKGLPGFRWESSLRTWAYVLARRACSAYRRSRAEWRERHVRFSDVPGVEALIVQIRTTTMSGLRERRRTRAQRLRAGLSFDEQALLTLRVDRNLEWREIARVLAEEDGELGDEAALTRAAAALRKRFERLKEKLRRLAAEEPEG